MATSVVFRQRGPLGVEFEVDPKTDRLVVIGVIPDGQGEQLGVRVGQSVVSVQNKAPKSSKKALTALMKQKRPLTVGLSDHEPRTEVEQKVVGTGTGYGIPRSPFGQRRCVLTQPPTCDLRMTLGADLVVSDVLQGGAADEAKVPTGWKVVAVEDQLVLSSVQFAVLVSKVEPGKRVVLLLQPWTEDAKIAAVASKFAAIHRGRQVRNPPPEIPPEADSDEENDQFRSPDGPPRSPKHDRTGRWYTAPQFTPGQEQALRRIQAAGRGHIARQNSRELSCTLSQVSSQVELTSPHMVSMKTMNMRELRALADAKGVDAAKIAEARNSDEPKAALIALIAATIAARAEKKEAPSSLRDGPAENFWGQQLSLTFAEPGPLGLVFSSTPEDDAPVLLSRVVPRGMASRSTRLREALDKCRAYEARAMDQEPKTLSDEFIRRLFEQADKKREGKISRAEVIKLVHADSAALSVFGLPHRVDENQQAELERVFQCLDEENSHGVDLPTFAELMRKQFPEDKSRHAQHALSLVGINGVGLRRANMTFAQVLDAICDSPRPIILNLKWIVVDTAILEPQPKSESPAEPGLATELSPVVASNKAAAPKYTANGSVESRTQAWESRHDAAGSKHSPGEISPNDDVENARAGAALDELAQLRRIPISEWNTTTVSEWLQLIGQQRYVRHWRKHCVDGSSLLQFKQQPSSEWPWKILEQLGVRPLAHRVAIVAELGEVNGWQGVRHSAAVSIDDSQLEPRMDDKDAKLVVMEERELRRLRLRVERESVAATKAAKAEAACAAKLKKAQVALEQFESADKRSSFSSLSDDSECSFAPRINITPDRRPLRNQSPARVQQQQQRKKNKKKPAPQPDGGDAWARKLDGVPPVAQPNYTRARSPVSSLGTARSTRKSADQSNAPSPEHGDRFQAFGGKLDEEAHCTFSPSTNPVSAAIARVSKHGSTRLEQRFDQSTVVERRRTVSTESTECTFTPRLNAGLAAGHGEFEQRLASDLAQRAKNQQKRSSRSHYVSGDEGLGIEHGGINRGFRAKSPSKPLTRAAVVPVATSAATAQSIAQHASRLTQARSPLSFPAFPPRDLSPNGEHRDHENLLSPESPSRQGQQARHRDAFRYRDRYNEHGQLHSDGSSEEEGNDHEDTGASPTHRIRDNPARSPSESPALQVLQLASKCTEMHPAQSTPTRASVQKDVSKAPKATLAEPEAAAVAGGTNPDTVQSHVTPCDHDDADHEARCAALELAIRTIEDAIESDPDNMQLLGDLQHLHHQHVKAVNAATHANLMTATATSSLDSAGTPCRADSAARLTDRTF